MISQNGMPCKEMILDILLTGAVPHTTWDKNTSHCILLQFYV